MATPSNMQSQICSIQPFYLVVRSVTVQVSKITLEYYTNACMWMHTHAHIPVKYFIVTQHYKCNDITDWFHFPLMPTTGKGVSAIMQVSVQACTDQIQILKTLIHNEHTNL